VQALAAFLRSALESDFERAAGELLTRGSAVSNQNMLELTTFSRFLAQAMLVDCPISRFQRGADMLDSLLRACGFPRNESS